MNFLNKINKGIEALTSATQKIEQKIKPIKWFGNRELIFDKQKKTATTKRFQYFVITLFFTFSLTTFSKISLPED
jgi:hypothetical protein